MRSRCRGLEMLELLELVTAVLAYEITQFPFKVAEEGKGCRGTPLLAHEQHGRLREKEVGCCDCSDGTRGGDITDPFFKESIANLIVVLHESDERGGR